MNVISYFLLDESLDKDSFSHIGIKGYYLKIEYKKKIIYTYIIRDNEIQITNYLSKIFKKIAYINNKKSELRKNKICISNIDYSPYKILYYTKNGFYESLDRISFSCSIINNIKIVSIFYLIDLMKNKLDKLYFINYFMYKFKSESRNLKYESCIILFPNKYELTYNFKILTCIFFFGY
jgi:hypothetical protein